MSIIKCTRCGSGVGFFKLDDGFCGVCLDEFSGINSKLSRLRKSMPVLFWLLPLLALFQFALSLLDAPTSKVTTPLEFSLIVVSLLFAPLLICFILRFYLIRRRFHFLLSLMFTFFIFSIPIGILMMLKTVSGGGNSPSLISVLFLVAGYKLLRTDNVEDPAVTLENVNGTVTED